LLEEFESLNFWKEVSKKLTIILFLQMYSQVAKVNEG
jgi:hypothetical protein